MSAKKDKKEKKKYKQEGEDEEGEDGREIKLSLTKKQGKLKSFIMLTNDKWQMNAEIPSSNAFAEDFIPLTPLCKSTQVLYQSHFFFHILLFRILPFGAPMNVILNLFNSKRMASIMLKEAGQRRLTSQSLTRFQDSSRRLRRMTSSSTVVSP